MSFIFGKGTPWTYEQLQRKRDIADAMARQIGSPQNVGEGLTAIGKALAARGLNKRADKRDAELKSEFDADWSRIFGNMPSQGATTPYSSSGAAVQPSAVRKSEPQQIADDAMVAVGKEPLQSDMAGLISETAAELGMDPVDLATIISYETAGTFDPVKRGPTTQWGQHKGLIQFGEPQAQEYGVDWNDPVGSQLGRDGAIVRYFRQNGWQPSMGILDAYSIVNAGAPGRYSASDANNGGAPGTVADKVRNQMGGHRQKAMALLGGQTSAPSPSVQQVASAISIPDLARVAGSPYASQGQRAIVQAMLQQQMQALDPAYQLGLEKQRLELEQLRNPPEPQRVRQVTGADLGMTGEDAGRLFNLKPDGAVSAIGGGGVNVTNNMPAAAPTGQPLGTKGQILVPDESAEGGYRVVNAEGSEAARAAAEAETELAQTDEREATQAGNEILSADTVLNTISEIREITKPKESLFGRITDLPETGIIGERLARSGLNQEAVDVKNKLATLESKIAFDRLQKMREASKTGGALGAVSERELLLLSSDMGALAQSSSDPEFQKVLSRIEERYTRIMQKFAADPALLDEYPELQQFASAEAPTPVTSMTREQFFADPSAAAAAEAAGVTVEDMWRILEAQR